MHRREFLTTMTAGPAVMALARTAHGTANRPTNILIIMADQMTAALTGAYGHPVVQTPALNQLCAEGIRFDAAYTNCPVCTPARAAMLSGRYVSRTRTYDNAAILPSDIPTYAHHLRLAGYQTAASGKMHLVGADQLHGFEQRLTKDIYPTNFNWTPDWRDYHEHGIQNQKGKEVEEKRIGVRNRTHQFDYDTEVQRCALEFIQARRADTNRSDLRPFCLLVSFTHPHPPYLITQEYWDRYEGADIDVPENIEEAKACRSQMDRWLQDYEGVADTLVKDADLMRAVRRTYYAMVSYVDDLVGELLRTLEECGLREDTAILFTSDHGDMLCERQLIEKRCFYEWSARVPLIASYPKCWQQGTTRAEPVSLIDLFPTLAEFTKAPAPEHIDGRSFLNLLEGKKDTEPGRTVFSEYHCEGVAGTCFMVRKDQFKYIYINGYDTQLFDLEYDPKELHNLAGQAGYGAVEKMLRAELFRQFDPEAIEKDVYQSQADRLLMREAMKTGQEIKWDLLPQKPPVNP